MKAKRIVGYILCILTVAALALSLAGCLKIGMKENNVRSRLEKAGAVITLERTTPITQHMQSGVRLGDIMLARMSFKDTVDGEEKDTEQIAYVFFAQDARSADAVEEACESYIEENADTLTRWNLYRFEETVVCGYYKIVSVVRQY